MPKEYEFRIVVTDFEDTGSGAIEECFMQMFDRWDSAPYDWSIESVREAFPKVLRALRDKSICPKCEKPSMEMDEKGQDYMNYLCHSCGAQVNLDFGRKGIGSAVMFWETETGEEEKVLYERTPGASGIEQ